MPPALASTKIDRLVISYSVTDTLLVLAKCGCWVGASLYQ